MCPLTRKVHNGVNKFALLWSCGCLMSQDALDLCGENGKCPVCQTSIEKSDIINLYYNPESMDIKKRMLSAQKQKPKANGDDGKDQEKEEMLGKRKDRMDEKPLAATQKKPELGTNILDGLAQDGYNKDVFKSLFHQKHEVEDPDGLIFRNVRFGIR